MKIKDFSETGSKFPPPDVKSGRKFFTNFIRYAVEKEEFINIIEFSLSIIDIDLNCDEP